MILIEFGLLYNIRLNKIFSYNCSTVVGVQLCFEFTVWTLSLLCGAYSLSFSSFLLLSLLEIEFSQYVTRTVMDQLWDAYLSLCNSLSVFHLECFSTLINYPTFLETLKVTNEARLIWHGHPCLGKKPASCYWT